MNKDNLGQVFTPANIVEKMISLITNDGKILEPSCGNGAFLNKLPNAIGLELDSNIAHKDANIMDFFDWTEKVDVIIGNPPYVQYNKIFPDTLNKLPNILDKRSNLYLFFIWRSIDLLNDNGELIFIVPRDFIKTTGAKPLVKRLYEEGGFKYWEECGDTKIFKDANPNVVIFKWVKGQNHTIPIVLQNGYINFSKKNNGRRIEELFDIYVGGVSGYNKIYYNNIFGNINIATSTTKTNNKLTKAVYVNEPNNYLLQYKDKLITRKIKNFTEKNWWEWGRNPRKISGKKILVNCKTRDNKPFYISNAEYFDGSLLALVPKTNEFSIEELVNALNNNNWELQGFKVGGRLIFGQQSLSKSFLKI